jgi:nicotinamidase-related amidase
MAPLSAPRRALLVIDMQFGMFNGPQKPFDGERILSNINRLIAKARAANAPIFAVRHTGPDRSPLAHGSPAWQLLPGLDIDVAHDYVFEKQRPNCFIGTDLAAALARAEIQELVIVGMKTEYCVDSTCRASGDRGFQAVLVKDAHSTMDAGDLSAQAIIDHHNRILSGPFATLVATVDCVF